MKILITSGGTKVPIDPVRDITNMSRGTFGSKIATAALNQGHDVLYLISKDGRTPFKLEVNLFSELGFTPEKFNEHLEWCDAMRHSYHESFYRNYEDYAIALELSIREYRPDIIILAAAVSDYVVDASDSKVRSSEDLTIQMKKAAKLIGKVKQWSPQSYLVGFKLLVGATEEELLTAARTSIGNNGCDLVVANEFNSLKAGNHQIILVSPTFDPKVVTTNMAEEIIKVATQGKRG